MRPLVQSYVHGVSDKPLIGETIGALLDRIAAAGRTAPPWSCVTRASAGLMTNYAAAPTIWRPG